MFWTYLLTFKLIWVLSFYCNHVDKKNYLCRFSDSILANILAVKQDLCRKPFDLKIDDVRFVGYPMSLDPSKSKPGAHQIISFNITFVLRVCVKYFTHFSILSCYVFFIQGNFSLSFCLLPILFFKSALFSYCKQTFCWHLGTVNITCILMSCWLNCSCSWNMPGMYLSLLCMGICLTFRPMWRPLWSSVTPT